MKRLIVLFVFMCCVVGAMQAQSQPQGYVFINSETVFKSQTDYNEAIKQLDDLAKQYQQEIDQAFADLDEQYNNYIAQRGYLSETSKKMREDEIINRERELKQYQEQIFGPEGDLMKKRIELIKPIQERVFGVINSYAESHGLGMIIDRANNQTLLYYAPALDKTEEIINLLNTK